MLGHLGHTARPGAQRCICACMPRQGKAACNKRYPNTFMPFDTGAPHRRLQHLAGFFFFFFSRGRFTERETQDWDSRANAEPKAKPREHEQGKQAQGRPQQAKPRADRDTDRDLRREREASRHGAHGLLEGRGLLRGTQLPRTPTDDYDHDTHPTQPNPHTQATKPTARPPSRNEAGQRENEAARGTRRGHKANP